MKTLKCLVSLWWTRATITFLLFKCTLRVGTLLFHDQALPYTAVTQAKSYPVAIPIGNQEMSLVEQDYIILKPKAKEPEPQKTKQNTKQ